MTRLACAWRRSSVKALPVLLACVVLLGACGGPKRQARDYESWKAQASVTGDFDRAEARWRRELAQNPGSEGDVSLLADDPPQAPERYGAVAFADDERVPGEVVAFDKDSGDAEADPESDDFWNDVGTASFSALTVLFTVGMAVAPYLLL